MKTFILAAGKGTRLAPITHSIPKVLAPLAGEPLLAYQLRYLRRQGVSEVAINTHHHADQVASFVEGLAVDLTITLSHEPELLGTAGALNPLAEFFDAPMIVLYGDVVTDADLAALMDAHSDSDAIATVAYHHLADVEGKGVMEIGTDEQVTRFVEKPGPGRYPDGGAVSAGIYVLEPSILQFIGDGAQDFGFDVWPRVLEAGRTVLGHELRSAYLEDVGSSEALAQVAQDITDGVLAW